MRILIIEDERDLADLLARRLELAGHEIYVCTDGWTALQVAELFHPDVVLTDLAMPVLDGWQLATRLRESLHPETPLIIAISAHQSGDDYTRSQAAGIDFHLAKPQYFEQLTQILGRYAQHEETKPCENSSFEHAH